MTDKKTGPSTPPEETEIVPAEKRIKEKTGVGSINETLQPPEVEEDE